MRKYGIPFWKPIPFIRLLIPLIMGIIFKYYVAVNLLFLLSLFIFSLFIFYVVQRYLLPLKYSYRWIIGIPINFLFFLSGSLLLFFQDIRNRNDWLGHHLTNRSFSQCTLLEPVTEKERSYKVLASADLVWEKDHWKKVKGKVWLYFPKDSMIANLKNGTMLHVSNNWQPIPKAMNPGSFDYQNYSAMQGIHFQQFLKKGSYHIISQSQDQPFNKLLFSTRSFLLALFKKYVPGKKESGVAEALLIGYRDDLDKDLVQSYSNTGVVHIIAISGLHLGLIYGLLVLCFKPFSKRPWVKWAKPIFILLFLWGFSFLTGAAASILRSAVMFSFIVIGDSLGRKTNIYNTLAASAFCLLAYDPYFLWDVGFQLSYAAVTSIILFMKPIYKKIYFTNKILDIVWQLNAVTLSAQILTLPIILYYFHQFPTLFLFTNFIAVPLSSLILYAELLLIAFTPISSLCKIIGDLISWLIFQMNGLIERTDRLPFSVIENIPFSPLQTIILYLAIGSAAWWLMQQKMKGLKLTIFLLTACSFLSFTQKWDQKKQSKLVVYEVPRSTAIDMIHQDHYKLICDSIISVEKNLEKMHLQATRLQLGATKKESEQIIDQGIQQLPVEKLSVLVISRPIYLPAIQHKIRVDLIILNHATRVNLKELAEIFDCPLYVFDGSNSLWKIQEWKKEADNLHLRHHSTAEQGALVVDL